MSSEALEPPFDREQILGRVKVAERGETTLYERALLAEVARLEQERDAAQKWANTMEHERDWEIQVVHSELLGRAEAAAAALAVAREREQRLTEAGEALAERVRALVSMNDHRLSRERSAGVLRAWAALVNEPAAALAEPGGIGGSEATGATTAAGRRVATPGLKTDASSPGSASAAADEPGETP